MTRARAKRLAKRALQAIGVIAVTLMLIAVIDGWKAFGHRAQGVRRARMESSPQWKARGFANPEPIVNDWWGAMKGMLDVSPDVSPRAPLPPFKVDPRRFETQPETGLRVTWLGHSTVLVEIDGLRVLTDPLWSARISPLSWVGPRRWYPPPIALDELPAIDAVVISHDHYDHLDYETISAIKGWNTTFVVPLGVGAHLEYWGVPAARIVELDWWERTAVGGLEIVATPARHASGRTVFSRDSTLWAGYALIGPAHRVYFSGDTGLFSAMEEIGAKLGPFDVTMIDAGQYNAAWPDWHIGPELAIRAQQMVRGKALMPIHWGLVALAYHGWTEPVERLEVAARSANATILTPQPGQSVEPERAPATDRWWPRLPWKTALGSGTRPGAGEVSVANSQSRGSSDEACLP